MAEGRGEHLAETPETVLAMLQARIARLDGGPRRAVRAAALFGQTFRGGGVAAVLGLSDQLPIAEWLQALEQAEVIEPQVGREGTDDPLFSFRHGLMRDAAYALLTDADRTTGHHRAAQYLEATGGQDAAAIAEHYERGGDRARAVPFYQQAGMHPSTQAWTQRHGASTAQRSRGSKACQPRRTTDVSMPRRC